MAAHSARPVLLSALVWPGAGQVYAGSRIRGGLLIFLTLGLAIEMVRRVLSLVLATQPAATAAFDPMEAWNRASGIMAASRAELFPLTLALIAVWCVGIVDAWRPARTHRPRADGDP